jgi:hypothetical protein
MNADDYADCRRRGEMGDRAFVIASKGSTSMHRRSSAYASAFIGVSRDFGPLEQ